MILGRQPALGIAELESIYGANKLQRVGKKAVIVDVDPCLLAFDRLGGSVKFCKLLAEIEATDWRGVEKFLLQVSPAQSQKMPEGKMLLGLSALGFDIEPAQLKATGLKLKKAIQKTGRSVRVIPNKSPELNTAQVLHNRLTTPNGWELYLVRDGAKTLVAQTVKVQDIEAYTLRDRGRPKRDARVGMLPPKLAQILINLATGKLPPEQLQNICEIPAGQPIPKNLLNKNLLDPFCGTGVVLQEALLMGYNAYGSDLDQRMVDYSTFNITNWLRDTYDFAADTDIRKADATTDGWNELPQIDFVASETYLGRPFTTRPGAEILNQTVSECNLIIKKFLKNIHGRIKPGVRLCLAVPAWQFQPGSFKYLPLIDQISDLGYNRVSFEQVRDEDLVYYREDQVVARQLLVITRK